MATISEDYCSYEVAKLLNEKGFQIDTDKDYWKIGEDGTMYFMCSIGAYTSDANNKFSFYRPKNSYPCPTQSVAMKWLREVHNISIEVIYDCSNDKTETISWWLANIKHINSDSSKENDCLTAYNSYEEACEAAIKYCLKNLI